MHALRVVLEADLGPVVSLDDARLEMKDAFECVVGEEAVLLADRRRIRLATVNYEHVVAEIQITRHLLPEVGQLLLARLLSQLVHLVRLQWSVVLGVNYEVANANLVYCVQLEVHEDHRENDEKRVAGAERYFGLVEEHGGDARVWLRLVNELPQLFNTQLGCATL